MTETLEQIKQTIAEAHEQGIYNWNTATISSLITTIESQQQAFEKQVEGHKYTAGRYSDEAQETKRLNSLVKSQKEEIQLQHDAISEAIAKWEYMQMDDDPVTVIESVIATLKIGHFVGLQEGEK